MATAPRALASAPWTWADLEAVPDDGYRREIIDGALIVTPAPVRRHQRALSRLLVVLAGAATPEVEVIPAPFDWRHADGGVVEPDLVVVDRVDADLDGPLPAESTPLLVVEILSPSTSAIDRTVKRERYECLAVPAYWIVDPVAPAVTALRLVGGRYEIEAEVQATSAFATDWPYPVSFSPAELLA